MSKLEQIQAFLKVIDENSFSVAAEKLFLSPAAISRQVANLEKHLRVQLINRTTRQLSLTFAGEQYYQQCKLALSQLNHAEATLTNRLPQPSGQLNITSNRYFAKQFLLPKLAAFLKKYPELQVELELAERFPNLLKENVHIIFGVSLDATKDLMRKTVMQTRYVLCGSPKYFKQQGMLKHPKELSAHRYITHSMRPNPTIIQFKQNMKVSVKPFLSLNDANSMRECAINGMGLVNLHDYMVEDDLAKHKLIAVLEKFQPAQQPVYLYYLANDYLSANVKAFLDFYLPLK